MDEVEAAVEAVSNDRRREGRILRVLSRNTEELVGTYERSNHFGFVIPDNPKVSMDIFCAKGDRTRERPPDRKWWFRPDFLRGTAGKARRER